MSCKDQLGNSLDTCQGYGSSAVPKLLSELTEDQDGLLAVISQYRTWNEFLAGFEQAVTPEYEAYKKTVSALHKMPNAESRAAFTDARQVLYPGGLPVHGKSRYGKHAQNRKV